MVNPSVRQRIGLHRPALTVASGHLLTPCTVSSIGRQLQEKYRMTNNRTKPEWGEAIFSEHCVITRPAGEEALADFVKYAIAVTRMHLQIARLTMPVQTNRRAPGQLAVPPSAGCHTGQPSAHHGPWSCWHRPWP